jgi:hypothetical protein
MTVVENIICLFAARNIELFFAVRLLVRFPLFFFSLIDYLLSTLFPFEIFVSAEPLLLFLRA